MYVLYKFWYIHPWYISKATALSREVYELGYKSRHTKINKAGQRPDKAKGSQDLV